MKLVLVVMLVTLLPLYVLAALAVPLTVGAAIYLTVGYGGYVAGAKAIHDLFVKKDELP